MSERVHASEPALSATAERLLSSKPDHPCFAPTGADAYIEPIGSVDRICITVGGRVRYVEMTSGHRHWGLLYNALLDKPPVRDQCIKPLYGPWWQIEDLAGTDCPGGFEFAGA